MQIQQLSVFVENKPGRLAEITEALAGAGVDIRAISVADTSDFGILRVIVDKPQQAVEALKSHGMTVSLTNVIAVGFDDKPGCFASAVRLLADKGFDMEYMYAFISRDKGKAYVIIRVSQGEKAAETLKATASRSWSSPRWTICEYKLGPCAHPGAGTHPIPPAPACVLQAGATFLAVIFGAQIYLFWKRKPH